MCIVIFTEGCILFKENAKISIKETTYYKLYMRVIKAFEENKIKFDKILIEAEKVRINAENTLNEIEFLSSSIAFRSRKASNL